MGVCVCTLTVVINSTAHQGGYRGFKDHMPHAGQGCIIQEHFWLKSSINVSCSVEHDRYYTPQSISSKITSIKFPLHFMFVGVFLGYI